MTRFEAMEAVRAAEGAAAAVYEPGAGEPLQVYETAHPETAIARFRAANPRAYIVFVACRIGGLESCWWSFPGRRLLPG